MAKGILLVVVYLVSCVGGSIVIEKMIYKKQSTEADDSLLIEIVDHEGYATSDHIKDEYFVIMWCGRSREELDSAIEKCLSVGVNNAEVGYGKLFRTKTLGERLLIYLITDEVLFSQ